MFPTHTRSEEATYNVRKKGALGNFPGKSVLTIWLDKAMMAIVAGTMRMEAYLTEEANTALSSLGSFCSPTFTNVGNSAVEIGMLKNVMSTAKYDEAL